MTIVYACDDNYWIQTLVSMVSLMEHQKHSVDLVLLDSGVSAAHRERMSSAAEENGHTFRVISADAVTEKLGLDFQGYHTASIFAKLLLPELLETDAALYLDSDTVVCQDLTPLFLSPYAGEKAAWGVEMPYRESIKTKVGADPALPYVSDGVLLMHLDRWREQGYTGRCMQHIKQHGGNPPMLSEGTINSVLREEIGVLPLQYNLMSLPLVYGKERLKRIQNVDTYYEGGVFEEALAHPAVIHFLTEWYVRPWYKNSDHPLREQYTAYLKKLELPLPEAVYDAPSRTKMNKWLYAHLPFGFYRAIKRLA